MIRQSFTNDDILKSADDFGVILDPLTLEIHPSNRGSAALVDSDVGPLVIKYARLDYAPTEVDIHPSRSVGLGNEAQRLGKLSTGLSPKLIGYSATERGVGLATECVIGSTVIEARNKILPASEIIGKLLVATDTLQKVGLLHGDIHPDNMFLNQSGDLVLIDFEFAHEIGEEAIAAGHHDYLSPEVSSQIVSGQQPVLDQREETFAITAAALSITTGQKPVLYDPAAGQRDQVLRFLANKPAYSTAGAAEEDLPLARALAGILDSHPLNRPTTSEELADILNASLAITGHK